MYKISISEAATTCSYQFSEFSVTFQKYFSIISVQFDFTNKRKKELLDFDSVSLEWSGKSTESPEKSRSCATSIKRKALLLCPIFWTIFNFLATWFFPLTTCEINNCCLLFKCNVVGLKGNPGKLFSSMNRTKNEMRNVLYFSSREQQKME